MSHQMLTVKCLQCLNTSLHHNICNLAEDSVGSKPHHIENVDVIPEALGYSCLHWASHFAITVGNGVSELRGVIPLLSKFVYEHLLHWFECLSALGVLESGIQSLDRACQAISVSTLPLVGCFVDYGFRTSLRWILNLNALTFSKMPVDVSKLVWSLYSITALIPITLV